MKKRTIRTDEIYEEMIFQEKIDLEHFKGICAVERLTNGLRREVGLSPSFEKVMHGGRRTPCPFCYANVLTCDYRTHVMIHTSPRSRCFECGASVAPGEKFCSQLCRMFSVLPEVFE